MRNLERQNTQTKMPTGIEGYDHISHGGLSKGRATLVAGSSGSGKTVFAVQTLYRQLTTFANKAVFVTLEEVADDIIRNAKSMNLNLNELIEQKKLIILDSSPRIGEVEVLGRINLSGLLVQIEYAVKQIDAGLVVIDSIGVLFSQYSEAGNLRHEIFLICDRLKNMGVTTILTSERTSEYGTISRHGIEEFVSDNVIVLRSVLEQERVRRTIQIFKMRGENYDSGEFPFILSSKGISLTPISAIELTQMSSMKRISSGLSELDKMTDGGFFRESILLVSGPTGCGKTLLGITFVAEACKEGRRALLLAYEESLPQIIRNAKSWGYDFNVWQEQGLLKIVCLYPEVMPLEHHLYKIKQECDDFKPERLGIDSLSALERIGSVRTFREFVMGLTAFCKSQEMCSLFTAATPQLTGGSSITETHISTITDIIIALRYVELDGSLRRGLALVKMRGSQHDKNIHEYSIDESGMHIEEPFKNVQNILLGIPTSSSIREIDRLEGLFNKGEDA